VIYKLKCTYIATIIDVTKVTNLRKVEWATYKLKYASCKHRPIAMFLEL
jgi:hypothetical protein